MDSIKISERGADMVRQQIMQITREQELPRDPPKKVSEPAKIGSAQNRFKDSREVKNLVRQLESSGKTDEVNIDMESKAETEYTIVVRKASTNEVILRMTPEEASNIANQKDWLKGLLVNRSS